jgi:serine/threonine protein kinase
MALTEISKSLASKENTHLSPKLTTSTQTENHQEILPPPPTDAKKRQEAEELLRLKNQEFYIQKIERDIDFNLVKMAFQKNAATIESFIKENLKKMISSLIISTATQKKSLFEEKHICDLKVRFFHGEVQVLVKSWLGRGGFKNIETVAQLAGPFLPHQPGPIYAYGKVEERKKLRQELKCIEQQISSAVESNSTLTKISELRQKKTKLQAKIEYIQHSLLEESSISKEFSHSDVIQMWTVTNQKDPTGIKGVMMKLCDRGDLFDFVNNSFFPLSPAEVQRNIGLAARIAQALADMHAQGRGRCHLDLKSGNILLTTDENGKIVPKLTDFGLTKYTGTFLKHVCGTPAYIAPELYDSPKNAHPSMDTWSLGIVCTELFYGLTANRFLWDKEANSVARDFFNHDRHSKNKALWERLGDEIKENLYRYPAIDEVIRHLLDINPITRWTAQKAAEAFQTIYSTFPTF